MWLLSGQEVVGESGLFESFTDYHCHLLPGVDDGVQKLNETLSILQVWEEQGVQNVWLTPHIMEDIPNKTHELRSQFDSLKAQYAGSIGLHIAAENMIDNILTKRLHHTDLLPIGNEGTHLLVETSYFNPPYEMDDTLADVLAKGFYPVLAHPERYNYMKIGDYRKLKDRRILFQLNIPSLLGAYGKEVQQKAETLLNKGYYDLCGTDTHSMRFVKFYLSAKISKKQFKAVRELIENASL